LRISLILTKTTGFLKPILLSMKLGVAPILGNRKQSFEWIHLDDLTSFILFSLKNKNVSGAYNIATDKKTNQEEFLNIIKNKYFKYSLLLNIPTFVLKLLLGQRIKIVSSDIAVSVDKLKLTGFLFKYPNVDVAIDKEFRK
jgi:NAD dependent epimerase/dehydratase family enzyme